MKQTIEISGRELTEQRVQSCLLELPSRDGKRQRQCLLYNEGEEPQVVLIQTLGADGAAAPDGGRPSDRAP